MMITDIGGTVNLHNGVVMSYFGLGVFESIEGRETIDAIHWAFEAGYRHIDTASMYGNERSVGDAIRKGGIKREHIFITTKVWNSDQGYQNTLDAFQNSLEKLQLDYVNLYLIHWPVRDNYINTWEALEELYRRRLVRATGVSNFLQLIEIGNKYDKTPVQVTLRWDLQKGIVTIPKSVKKERIVSNADIFDFQLTEDDMKNIDSLDKNRRIGADPDNFNF